MTDAATSDRWREGPLGLGDPDAVAALGRVLREASYDLATLRDATGARGDFVTPTITDRPIVARQLSGEPRLVALARLFLLNEILSPGDAAAAVEPVPLERLEAAGVLRPVDGGVTATIRLVPLDDLVFACDRVEMEYEEDNAEFAAPINPSTLSLDMLTVRRPVGTTLDLGTGPGFQALRAARTSGHVVGTDLNHRALNYAAWSAQLNGLDNVEWRYGDLWEPVAGERFDHVLCNPPYIVSPDWEYLYSSSGREGDAVSEDVVRGIPQHLAEGGIGQALCSWIVHDLDADDWAARPRSWVEGTGCDAFIFHFKTDLPLDTASVQRTVLLSHDPAEISETLDRWTDYYRRIGAAGVSYGGIVLRRRTGGRPNWIRVEKLSTLRAGVAGGHVLRLIDAQDRLLELPAPEAILDERLVLATPHTLVERMQARGGAWQFEDAELSLDEGLGFAGSIDPPTLRLLPLLDGVRTVREALGEVAAAFDMAEPPEHREAFIRAGIPMVTRLFSLGFLVSAEA